MCSSYMNQEMKKHLCKILCFYYNLNTMVDFLSLTAVGLLYSYADTTCLILVICKLGCHYITSLSSSEKCVQSNKQYTGDYNLNATFGYDNVGVQSKVIIFFI